MKIIIIKCNSVCVDEDVFKEIMELRKKAYELEQSLDEVIDANNALISYTNTINFKLNLN